MSSASPVAALLRVSTKGQSLEPQRLAINEWCERNKYPPPRFYMEKGVSGADPVRPKLDKLLRDVKRGGIEIVVVAAFDRVGRSVLRVLDFAMALGEAGVEFVSLREGINTSGPTGRLVLTVFSAIAEFERAMIRDRIKAGLAAARAKGVKLGRPGWRWDDDADATLASMVSDGMSPEAIAKTGKVIAWIRRRDKGTGELREVAGKPTFGPIRRRMADLGI
jgi:DNA invertase Pin-like site-specific DNA recombinase